MCAHRKNIEKIDRFYLCECVLGPTAMEEGAGEQGGHGAARRPCCLRAWLREENSKGERENAEEGRDNGVHFKPSAHAHARGEWGLGLSMMAMFKCLRLAQKYMKNRLNLYFLDSLSPKPFSSGTKCSNKSCISTLDLQLCLKDHSLTQPG